MKNSILFFVSIVCMNSAIAQDFKLFEKKKHNVYSVAFSRDSKLLATGAENGDVAVWDVDNQGLLQEMQGHYDMVLALAFSPDGYYVASASRDNSIKVWSIGNGILAKNFVGHQAAVTSIVFSPDGKYLYSGGADNIISIWDIDKNMKVSELRGHTKEVSGIAITADGETLASSSFDGSVKIWDLNANIQQAEINLRGGWVRAVSFSPDGKFLAAASDDKSVRIVDMETHSIGLFLRGHKDWVYSIAFSPDNKYIFSGSMDNSVRVWSAETGLVEKTFPKLGGFVCLSVSNNGQHLAIADMTHKTKIHNLSALNIKPAKLPPLSGPNVSENRQVNYTQPVKTQVVFNKNKPSMNLIQPKIDYSKDFFLHLDKEMLIKGTVKSENGLFELTINNEEIPVINDNFSYTLKLAMGNNTVRIKAVDIYNNIHSETFVVQRQLRVANVNDTLGRQGKDYALIICTDEYDQWSKLTNPVFDGETIAKELEQNYNFITEVVKNPTRNEILSILRNYNKRQFADDDQLFIFIAGHGEFDPVFSEGYIVAKDSKANDEIKESYISHSNLRTIINNIPCNHTLLVMDVCFGGTFDPFVATGRGRMSIENERMKFIERKMKYDTRRYLTSGGKEYVPDGRPGHHSPFARRLIDALRSGCGDDRILTFGELYSFVETVQPHPTTGEFGRNQPGSDFLFILKD